MGKISKIVLFENAVETLGYFSKQIGNELTSRGLEVFYVDYNRMEESLRQFHNFAKKDETALLTFNFIGLSQEEIFLEQGKYLWEQYHMQYLNILVDHPMYYHKKLLQELPGMKLFCVDREHVDYMKRFYPQMSVTFLPLAGNEMLPPISVQTPAHTLENIPFEKRTYDLIFTGNYVPIQDLEDKMKLLEPDYQIFYHEIIEDVIANPLQSLDAVMERHILAELGKVSERELCSAMSGMILIDLYLRTYFREKVIKELAEADCKIHLFGADWEKMPAAVGQKNVIANGRQLSSAECVALVADARISLNILPGFRDGAHDRIFTAMLQHTVALTDFNLFLREHFEDKKELAFFSLRHMEELPKQVEALLSAPQVGEQIAAQGYQMAKTWHTWKNRVDILWETLFY